jgi:hypothetical protein
VKPRAALNMSTESEPERLPWLTSAHLAIDGTEAEALSKLDAHFGALFSVYYNYYSYCYHEC